jgi:hypothetical protein
MHNAQCTKMHAAVADPMRPLRKECTEIATSKVQVNHSPWSLENSPPRRQQSVASVGSCCSLARERIEASVLRRPKNLSARVRPTKIECMRLRGSYSRRLPRRKGGTT